MDDRGVSRVLSYSLVLTISAVLVTGLLIAGGSFVTEQRSQVVNSELKVVGQRLAADVATADRLVRMGQGETMVRIDSHVPGDVAGSHYNVEVVASGGDASLRIAAPQLDRQVTVPVSNRTDLAPGTARGGDVVVRYNETTDRLEVTGDG